MGENINIEESKKRNAIVFEKDYGGMKILSIYPLDCKDSKENLASFFTKLAKTVVKGQSPSK